METRHRLTHGNTNNRFRFVLVFVYSFIASLVGFVASAYADTIWLVDASSPVFGIVEASDENSITFQQTTDGKSFEKVSIARSNVSAIVINVQSQRLEALVNGEWQSWHDYAEELLSQREDPVARGLAMRLLVIVVGNSKNAQQRSAALRDLIALARNETELRNFRQLLFLETGEKQPVGKNSQPILPGPEDRQAAARLVQAVRLGRDVSAALKEAKLKQTVSAFAQVCSWDELVQLSNSNRIEKQGLRQLVALEYALRTGETVAQQNENDTWNVLAGRVATETFSLPTIKTVTEYDPPVTRFVGGPWK